MEPSCELAKKMLELMPETGVVQTDVPCLSLIKVDQVMAERRPIMYEPCIYIVLQGSKSAFLGQENYVYDALHYLVLSVPLPLECQILSASKQAPYLAVSVAILPDMLSQIIEELPAPEKRRQPGSARGIFISKLGPNIKATLGRLLSYVGNPASAKILGGLAVKELLFHVLAGEQGEQLKAFAYRDKHHFQISKIIHFIQKHYAEVIEVADLAAQANMSPSSFHAYFKAVTNATPIQYIKTIRLHEAKKKMIYDNHSASDAAFHVGYGSPSQFSREYRRLFGAPPSQDARSAQQSI